MRVGKTVRRQYQTKVDEAATGPAREIQRPAEGWIATVRKALGISAAQLGRMAGSTRANISAIEQSERNDRTTLQTMKTMADAMDCKLVYAIVPKEGCIEDILKKQARRKARAIVTRANTHMALEKQAIDRDRLDDEIEGLARDLLRNPPSNFWKAG